VPAWGGADARYPLLVALHGRGEALKPPLEGSMGWARDYALVRAIARLASPPLTPNDYEGFVEPGALTLANESLSRAPFGGLVVVCPHLPDIDPRDPRRIAEFEAFLFTHIVPRAKRELPILDSPSALGIDGISLGGATALWTGLASAEKFGAVGTLQPAIWASDADAVARAVRKAREKNPKLPFRLLTSYEDTFRRGIETVSRKLREQGLQHELVIVPGPHDYPFNRGPGALEMLMWHDRWLRGA
jgi:acetyl esterase/lipase